MPRILIDAHELSNAQVSHISLVKRGANRIPFRILKSAGKDEPMIDLTKFELFKKNDPVTRIAAIMVAKGVDLEAVKKSLTETGFSIDDMEEQEAGTVFKQEDYEGDLFIFKLSDELAVGLVNVGKSFQSMNFESDDFKEVFSQEGVFPSISVAMGALQTTIGNVLQKAGDKEEANTGIKKAVDDFSKFISGVVGSIPVDAFKLEDVFSKAEKDAPDADDKKKSEDKSGEQTPGKEDAKKAEGDKANVDKADAKAKATEGNDNPDDGDKKKPEDDNSANAALDVITKAISDLKDGITSEIGTLSEKVTGLGTRLDKVETLAKSADDALSGMTSSEEADDGWPVSKEEKALGEAPLIDTGFGATG